MREKISDLALGIVLVTLFMLVQAGMIYFDFREWLDSKINKH